MGQQTVGRYRILEEAAKGSQGAVYRAFDPDNGRIVALKVLHPNLTADSSYIERFRREARIAASIDHPNVVRIFDVGQDGDSHFISMEFLPENLARIIQSGEPLELDRVAKICVQIAAGLAAAHDQGIVHRDIKPQNVLMSQDGTMKVTDFGISRSEALSTMTATGAMLGTPHYMSPEQAKGERADVRSDIYSLGCVLYQMLTGEIPFKGDTPLVGLRQHIEEEPPPIRTLRADLPQRVVQVVQRAMAKEPTRRFQTASSMAEALEQAVRGIRRAESSVQEETVSPAPPTAKRAPPPDPVTTINYCSNCGAQSHEGASFCVRCGRALESGGPPLTQPRRVDRPFMKAGAVAHSELAGSWRRTVSFLIETIVGWIPLSYPVIVIVNFVMYRRGKAIGVTVAGVRIVRENGEVSGFFHTSVRAFASFLSALPLGLGYWWAFWDPMKQTWHDKLLHTYALRDTPELAQRPASSSRAAVIWFWPLILPFAFYALIIFTIGLVLVFGE